MQEVHGNIGKKIVKNNTQVINQDMLGKFFKNCRNVSISLSEHSYDFIMLYFYLWSNQSAQGKL